MCAIRLYSQQKDWFGILASFHNTIIVRKFIVVTT